MKPKKKKLKKRVTLTIDPDVWERCLILKERSGANFSQIAEEVFRQLCDENDEMMKLHSEGGDLEQYGERYLLSVVAQYHQSLSRMYSAIDTLRSIKPENRSES